MCTEYKFLSFRTTLSCQLGCADNNIGIELRIKFNTLSSSTQYFCCLVSMPFQKIKNNLLSITRNRQNHKLFIHWLQVQLQISRRIVISGNTSKNLLFQRFGWCGAHCASTRSYDTHDHTLTVQTYTHERPLQFIVTRVYSF